MNEGYRWKVAEGLWVGPLPLAHISALVASGKVSSHTAVQDAEGHDLGLVIDQPELQEAARSWAATQATEVSPPIKLVPPSPEVRSEAPAELHTKDIVATPSSTDTESPGVPAVEASYVEDWSLLESSDEPTSEPTKAEHSFSGEWVDEDVGFSEDYLQKQRRIGLLDLHRGDFTKAAGIFEQLLLQSPEDQEALSARAFCRFHQARGHEDRVAQLEAVRGFMMTETTTTLWMRLFAIRMNLVLQRTSIAEDLLTAAAAMPCDDLEAAKELPVVRQMVEARRLDLDKMKTRIHDKASRSSARSAGGLGGRRLLMVLGLGLAASIALVLGFSVL